MKFINLFQNRKYFLAILTLAVLNLSGCTYTINATAKRTAEAYTKTFKLKVNRVDDFVSCLETPGGICQETNDFEDGSIESFFSDNQYSRTQSALDTTSDKPNFDLLDSSTTQLSNSQKNITSAIGLSADLAREVLNHPVQKQLNALFNTVKGVSGIEVYSNDLEDGQTSPLFKSSLNGNAINAEMNIALKLSLIHI